MCVVLRRLLCCNFNAKGALNHLRRPLKHFGPAMMPHIKSDQIKTIMYVIMQVFKSVICKNRPPVKLTSQADRGLHITKVTAAAVS